MGSAVLNHAKKRAERAFEVDQAKDEGLKVEQQIRQILKKMRGQDGWPSVPAKEKELDEALDEYVEKVHDPELVASAPPVGLGCSRREVFAGRARTALQGNRPVVAEGCRQGAVL